MNIALGSLAEVENFLELGKRLGYISIIDYNYADGMNEEIRKIIKTIISKIKLKMER